MMNIDCETKDKCRLVESAKMSTLLYFQPVYDGNGNNLNPDRNSSTSTLTCVTCGKVFDKMERAGIVTVTERK